MSKLKKQRIEGSAFKGSIAIVTGGSTGIGHAVCDEFVSRGAAAVYNLDVSSSTQSGVTHVKCDVSETKTLKKIISDIIQKHDGQVIDNVL